MLVTNNILKRFTILPHKYAIKNEKDYSKLNFPTKFMINV